MTNTSHLQLEVPVLILGAGPAGLVTAIELARHGIRPLLIEKHPGTSIYPRANSVSTRSMEIFRSWGIEPALRDVAIDAESVISLRPSLVSTESTDVQAGFPYRHEALEVSPTRPADIAQDALEPVLADYARSLGAELRFSCQLTELQEANDSVICTARDRITGAVIEVRARYVIGCDGTRSFVRNAAGIDFEGNANLGRWSTALFHADLMRRVPGRPALLYGITSFEHETLLVITSNDDRWLLATKLSEDQAGLDHLADDDLLALIRQASGVPDLEAELLARQSFYLGGQVASHFRRGNLFLAGDAAHRMTPQGGMGLNTAIHDAHNLAWKLAFVLKGWAGDDLLDSYEAERRPIGLRNTRRSMGEEEDRRPDGLDIDLAYQYVSLAVQPEEAPVQPTDRLVGGLPGTRLPHFWCEVDGLWASSLDLTDQRFTVIAPPTATGWTEAAHAVMAHTDLPVDLRRIASGVTPDGLDWRRACGIGEDGALLLRPDGFVFARYRQDEEAAPGRIASALEQALSVRVAACAV